MCDWRCIDTQLMIYSFDLHWRDYNISRNVKTCIWHKVQLFSLFLFFLSFRHGSGKMPLAAKSTPSPPVSAKGPVIKPKSSGKKKAKLYNRQEKQTNLSSNSPQALKLSSTSPAPVKQGIPLGQSVLVVTIKDKHVKVHMPSDSAPRSPTLVECKAIIKHQQETNKRQEQEVCFYQWLIKYQLLLMVTTYLESSIRNTIFDKTSNSQNIHSKSVLGSQKGELPGRS